MATQTLIHKRLAKPPLELAPARSKRLLISLLYLLFCVSCAEDRTPVDITFVATYAGSPLDCTSQPISLSDLRFYVSDLAFIDAMGNSHAVPLLRDDRWQTRDIALIDLENGRGTCVNGSEATNRTVKGTVEAGHYVGLSFSVGVPFEVNHANPILAEAPLDDAAMHWHWRSGYKFLRAGVSTPTDAFWVHLGSTGCEGSVQKITGCRFPNRVSVDLPTFVDGPQKIAFEFSALLDGVNLNDELKSDCSSGPAESTCRPIFKSLGIDSLGDKEKRAQIVFRTAH